MRILHITPQAPGHFSGGELGIYQTLTSLETNRYEVDYVGPEIKDKDIKSKYSRMYILEPHHNLPLRIYDTLHGNTNKRYRSWLHLKLDFTAYDKIILEFSKLDYVLDKVPLEKLIVRIHNVEADYSEKNYQYKKTWYNYLDKQLAKKREAKIAEKAENFLVLTKKDEARMKELYGIVNKKFTVIPVCVEDHGYEKKQCCGEEKITLLLTGSLWFGPNYSGITWFLDEVYPKLQFLKEVIIAGAHPNEELKERVRNMPDVCLIDTPDSMEPYFRRADLAVTPVFDGAGMKVKVAEALSYGVPVMGTSHAFIGYEVEHGIHSFKGDTAEEFVQGIYEYQKMNVEEREILRQNAYQLFKEKYSQSASSRYIRQVVEGVR